MNEATSSIPESSPGNGNYTVIARRYRPQTFEELVGQEHVARALQQAIASGRVGHAYLFTGARGVGKTSAARILAKALNCVKGPSATPCNECDVCLRVSTGDDVDVLEIDGASNRGIDEIRQLRQNVAVRPSRTRFKIYIIDEVHMLTKEAFNALLKTLEEPPEHVKFIFATTEAHKIPITILSRCQRFDFAGIGMSAIQARLAQIAQTEGVEIEPDAAQILASRAAGSMRDSQSLLEQLLAIAGKRITAADVNSLLGIAPSERLTGLVRHLVARDAAAALGELDATLQGGVEAGLLIDQLVGYFRDVMALAVGCGPDQMLYALPSQAAEVAKIGEQLGLQTILAIGQILDHTSARMRVSMHSRTLVEMAVVRICRLDDLDELAALVAELRGESPESPVPSSSRPTAPATNRPSTPVPSSLAEAVSRAIEPPDELDRRVESAQASANTPADVATRNGNEVGVLHSESTVEPVAEDVTTESGDGNESVLAQWQRALSDNASGSAPAVAAAQPRASRREQLAAVAEQPFVRRAMELFDASAGQLRYTPPEGESN